MVKRLIKAVSNEHFDDIFQYIDKMDDNKIRDLLVLCSKYSILI